MAVPWLTPNVQRYNVVIIHHVSRKIPEKDTYIYIYTHTRRNKIRLKTNRGVSESFATSLRFTMTTYWTTYKILPVNPGRNAVRHPFFTQPIKNTWPFFLTQIRELVFCIFLRTEKGRRRNIVIVAVLAISWRKLSMQLLPNNFLTLPVGSLSILLRCDFSRWERQVVKEKESKYFENSVHARKHFILSRSIF